MTTRLAGMEDDRVLAANVPAGEGAREAEQGLPASLVWELGDPGVQEQPPGHGVQMHPPCEACRGEQVLPPRVVLGLGLWVVPGLCPCPCLALRLWLHDVPPTPQRPQRGRLR